MLAGVMPEREIMDKDRFKNTSSEFIRELCRLVDAGELMSRDKFHDLCEKEVFVDSLPALYPGVRFEYLDKKSPIFNAEVVQDINGGLSRHANAVVLEDFGLANNALLFAVNLVVSVEREVL